jgi:hypothetical protein
MEDTYCTLAVPGPLACAPSKYPCPRGRALPLALYPSAKFVIDCTKTVNVTRGSRNTKPVDAILMWFLRLRRRLECAGGQPQASLFVICDLDAGDLKTQGLAGCRGQAGA